MFAVCRMDPRSRSRAQAGRPIWGSVKRSGRLPHEIRPCNHASLGYTLSMKAHCLTTVVETVSYLSKAGKLMSEQEREDIKTMIAGTPERGALIRGTGGVRKVRIPLQGRGKSRGARIVYYYRDESMPLFLLAIFAKNEKDDLSRAERNGLTRLVQELTRYGKG